MVTCTPDAIIGAVVCQGDDEADAMCHGGLSDVVEGGDAVYAIVKGCGVICPALVVRFPVLESCYMKCNEQTNGKSHHVRTVVTPAFAMPENAVSTSLLGCLATQYAFVPATG